MQSLPFDLKQVNVKTIFVKNQVQIKSTYKKLKKQMQVDQLCNTLLHVVNYRYSLNIQYSKPGPTEQLLNYSLTSEIKLNNDSCRTVVLKPRISEMVLTKKLIYCFYTVKP